MSINEKFKEILVKCNNDIEEMKEAFDYFLNHKIEVDDTVKVIDWGKNCSKYFDWFIENDISRELCLRYAYSMVMVDQELYNENDTFSVVAVHDGKALISSNRPINYERKTACYLVCLEGLAIAGKINDNFREILDECGDIKEMKKAFNEFIRNNKIEVGSVVRVLDWGDSYSTWKDWFTDHDIPIDLCLRYAYNTGMSLQKKYKESDKFKVLAVHNNQALITENYNDTQYAPCYLIEIDALEIAK